MSQKTPLYDSHVELGARMVEFAGWVMPVQYEGLKYEHGRVRNHVGLFDVSHMGEIRFKGAKALETLQWQTSNDVSKLQEGKAQYSLLTNFDGGIVDDIIVYCIKPNEDYLVCVNASNADKDFNWMIDYNKGADIQNESEAWGQIAVQGPKAMELGARVFGDELKKTKTFAFFMQDYKNSKIIVARTGYTGEDGFEVFVPKDQTAALWNEFLEKGKDLEVGAIGLGARDTLRTEMKYSLYGHEIDDTTNPIEAGLGWVTKLKKGEFVGSDVISRVKSEGVTRKLIGFKLLEKGIPRQGYSLFSFDNKEIGTVTSGTLSPTLNEPIGIGYVQREFSELGTEFNVAIRNRMIKAQVVETPFVQPKGEE